MLRAIVMAMSPKKKERTVKGDQRNQRNLAKDPLTVKSVFSLEHKEGKIVNGDTYLG